ncbi:MAG: TIGR01777 family oxidoreductase [Acidimicrobiales bacterium]
MSGSHGLIAGALVERLESDGHAVHRVVRARPKDGDAYLDLAQRSLDVSRLPDGSLGQIDVVFNLSGERITPWRWSAAKRERLRSSRILVTDLIARAIAAADTPPTVFVSASAVGIYGERGDEELDEQSAPGRGFLAELCRAWEDATEPARHANVRVVHVRSGIVIARHNPLVSLQLPLFRLGLGASLGSGRHWFSWNALEDEVAALIHAATNAEVEGPCNLTSPNPVRYREFATTFARAVGSRARLAVPRVVLDAAIGTEATREIALVSERVLPRLLLDTGYQFKFPLLDEAFANAIGSRTRP